LFTGTLKTHIPNIFGVTATGDILLIRVKSPCLPDHCSLCLGTGGSAHISHFVVVSFNYLQALTEQVGMLKSFKLSFSVVSTVYLERFRAALADESGVW
jgi:hypothetical protein